MTSFEHNYLQNITLDQGCQPLETKKREIFSILAGVLTKKREVEDEKAGDSKYMLFLKIYHE